jgi:hypothetical protein
MVALFALCVIASFGVAYKDIKLSANMMLIFEGVSLFFIRALGVAIWVHKGFAIDMSQVTLQGSIPRGVITGIVLVVLAFSGFESSTSLGAEAKDPLRTIPRSILQSTAISGAFFSLHGLRNQVYDIIERIWSRFKRADDYSVWDEEKAPAFRQAINEFFLTNGIGWQLVKGEIVMRGADGFEAAVKTAQATLEESGRPTASREIHEALEALSWRPEPDLRGAVYHTLGSLECLARAITGDPRATLGEILKKHPDLLPRPLHETLSKV